MNGEKFAGRCQFSLTASPAPPFPAAGDGEAGGFAAEECGALVPSSQATLDPASAATMNQARASISFLGRDSSPTR